MFGYNAQAGKFEDFGAAGVINPTYGGADGAAERCFGRQSPPHHRVRAGREEGRGNDLAHAWRLGGGLGGMY